MDGSLIGHNALQNARPSYSDHGSWHGHYNRQARYGRAAPNIAVSTKTISVLDPNVL